MPDKKTLSIKYTHFQLAALIYLLLPVVVFMFGFTKIWIALPAVALLVFCLINYYKKSDDSREIKITSNFIIVSSVIILLLVIWAGIGEFVYSTEDHLFRRAIFRDLINYKWPVIFDSSTQADPRIANYLGEGKFAFVYYFTYWLVPSLVGKVFGFTAGNIALVVWSACGLFIALIGMCFFVKKCSWGNLFMLLFACGADIIPFYINSNIGMPSYGWLEGYTHHLSYLSNMTNLMNVFNQCIPCWIVAILLLNNKDNRIIGLIGACLLAYSPWATIGVLPIAVLKLVEHKEDIKLKRVLSINNVVPVLLIGVVFGLFYMASSGAAMQKGFTWTFYDSFKDFAIGYLLLVLVDIVPFVVLSSIKDIKTPVYIANLIILLLIPFYMVSVNNDFCMRGSMPALFILGAYVAKNIAGVDFKRIRKIGPNANQIAAGLVLFLMISVFAYYFNAILAGTVDGNTKREDIGSLGNINDTLYVGVIEDQFYSKDYMDTIFFKYMAR